MQFSNIPPVVKNLLIINILCFLPLILIDHLSPGGPVTTHFGLYYFDSPNFRVWQIVTYMFLHGGWAHILFNMLALFSFGPILEYTIGGKRFFNLYFICGIGAAIFQLLVQAIEVHNIIGSFTVTGAGNIPLDQFAYAKLAAIYETSVVGASGAIFGILIAFGMLFPDMELLIMIIPVPVKAKYVILVYFAYEVFMGFGQFGGDNVAHFAHIGGAIIGFIMIKIWGLKRA